MISNRCRKLQVWQDERVIVNQGITRYVTNPLNAFLMIKRATSEIEQIKKRFPETSNQFYEKVQKILPSNDDLTGAVDGLLRLQFIYKLKSEDFANGIIDGEVTRKPLSPHDLFVIGSQSLELGDQLHFAEEYLKLAWVKLKSGLDINGDLAENDLLLKLIAVYKITGNYQKAIEIVDVLVYKNPGNLKFMEEKQLLMEDLVRFGTSNIRQNDPFDEFFFKNQKFTGRKDRILYSQVCRGHLKKSNEELSKLHCRYVSNSAFSKLARFKIEEANLEPYIVLFIDVVYESEIETLQEMTRPYIERAGIFADDTADGELSRNRVAQYAWHSDHEHEVVQRISNRVEVMSFEL